jgi:hypothetical protein
MRTTQIRYVVHRRTPKKITRRVGAPNEYIDKRRPTREREKIKDTHRINGQVRRGEPNARNEIRGSFARASRSNEGNVSSTPRHECDDRVLSGENECAARAWPELRTNVVARIF